MGEKKKEIFIEIDLTINSSQRSIIEHGLMIESIRGSQITDWIACIDLYDPICDCRFEMNLVYWCMSRGQARDTFIDKISRNFVYIYNINYKLFA